MDSPGVSRETPDSPNDFPGTQAPDHATPAKAEFCHTTNLTDVHTGRAFTQSIHNSTRVHILGVLGQFIDQVPFCDRLNHLSRIRSGGTNASTTPPTAPQERLLAAGLHSPTQHTEPDARKTNLKSAASKNRPVPAFPTPRARWSSRLMVLSIKRFI